MIARDIAVIGKNQWQASEDDGRSEKAVTNPGLSEQGVRDKSVVANQLRTGETNGDDSNGNRKVGEEAATNSAEERAQASARAQG